MMRRFTMRLLGEHSRSPVLGFTSEIQDSGYPLDMDEHAVHSLALYLNLVMEKEIEHAIAEERRASRVAESGREVGE